MDSGELIPVFAGSHPGYGSYHCDYFVFDAVKQMIRLGHYQLEAAPAMLCQFRGMEGIRRR